MMAAFSTHDRRGEPQKLRLGAATIISLTIVVAGWVFSAGMMYARMDELSKRVDKIEVGLKDINTKLDHLIEKDAEWHHEGK